MKSCREIEVYLHQKNSSLALEHNEFCIKNYLNWKIIIDIIFKRGNQVFEQLKIRKKILLQTMNDRHWTMMNTNSKDRKRSGYTVVGSLPTWFGFCINFLVLICWRIALIFQWFWWSWSGRFETRIKRVMMTIPAKVLETALSPIECGRWWIFFSTVSRSAYMCLGVPINIAIYALLTW